MKWIMVAMLWTQAAMADPLQDVAAAAHAAFDGLPSMREVAQIDGACGADETVNASMAYCTTRNQILIARTTKDMDAAPYMLAHLYGHAVQVRHGVADFALGQIRQRRSEEAMLRGLVTRQVECIAGFIIARSGQGNVDLSTLFATEPFTDSHWGRDPLRVGPQVSIGLTARAMWFAIGQEGDLAACGPGEFTADLLLEAYKS
jgi:hypothetical protein